MTRVPLDRIRLEDVAQLAQVSPATIYVHFGTKDALTAAVVNKVLQEVVAAFDIAAFATQAPLERIHEIGLTYIRLLRSHPAIVSYLAARASLTAETEQQHLVVSVILELRSHFEEQIDAAIGSGEIAGIDPRALSLFIFGGWMGVAALTLREDELGIDPLLLEQVVTQCWEALILGMRAQADSDGPRTDAEVR